MNDDRQFALFPELAPQKRARPRPPTLYPRAAARRQQVQKMTLKGKKVREIAAATNCTITHVFRIRAELRAAGRLPSSSRANDKR